MSAGRHSYIAFYPSDWIAGTARMTPMQELVYFRVCLYNWDKGEAVPAAELPLMLGTVPDWRVVLLDLVHAKKLVESPDGSVANTRAVSAAREAHELWEKKSRGGRTGAARTNAKTPKVATPAATPAKSPGETPAATPDSTAAASDDGTRPGLPSHNHNHNHNQNQPEGAPPSSPDGESKAPNEKPAPPSDAVRIIQAFDEERVKVFGPELARLCPAGDDLVHAERFIAAGASVELCRGAFRAALSAKKTSGEEPIGSLRYFEKPIARALAASTKPIPTDERLVSEIPGFLRSKKAPVPKGVIAGSPEWHAEQKRLGLEGEGEAA